MAVPGMSVRLLKEAGMGTSLIRMAYRKANDHIYRVPYRRKTNYSASNSRGTKAVEGPYPMEACTHPGI